MSVHESMSKARAAAARALQLDESLSAAHAALGQMQHTYDWNHQEAEDSFQRAINLEPNYETAHHWYALLLAHLGRFPEALERIKRAQQLDPVSAIILKDTGMIYYYARQYDRAAEQCHKALELAPDFYPAHSALGDIYLQQGKSEAALAEHRAPTNWPGRASNSPKWRWVMVMP
jgi:tetratricopeptide (TPR) repeat protein